MIEPPSARELSSRVGRDTMEPLVRTVITTARKLSIQHRESSASSTGSTGHRSAR